MTFKNSSILINTLYESEKKDIEYITLKKSL